ncbi:MAG: Thioredoxin family protein [uncultured Sulfurovum sp.]|uniref:Thioredoxin family protein n=1 Tax=uncultured Sulfurovum sp. TaxID=269237 RepID=A0A6S6TZV9_9BACT|nr:MAG: Thioredoxin family protein [uncultured Sulfurovum sp.]
MSVTVFFTYSLMAYNIGDTLDTKVSEKLNLKKDTLYVVDFFASWCHACKKELPLVAKVHNDKVVQVIGVNVDDDIAKGKNFVSKLKVPFSVIYDTDKSLITRFNPAGVPALYYIKNSKVLGSQIGAIKDIDKKITNDIKGLQ